MSAFETFGFLSNFKINLSTSEILNISVPHKTASLLKPSYPFSWQPHKRKYLGIFFTPNPALLLRENYIPLLNLIRQDLHKWNQLAHSWLGRINVVKMNILPRLLFLFQKVPYKVPPGLFTVLTSSGTVNIPASHKSNFSN